MSARVMFEMSNTDRRQDKEATRQDNLIVFFVCVCIWLCGEIQFDNCSQEGRVLSLDYWCVCMGRSCDLFANVPGSLALKIEATPASLPLLLGPVNVGSKRKLLLS